MSGPRRRHGAPPQPFRFFYNIHRHLIKPGLGFVALARRGSEPLAAAVFFTQGEKPFTSSVPQTKGFSSIGRTIWSCGKRLNISVHSGFENLHFGRTSLETMRLRRFKWAWGTQEETIRYFRLCPRTGEWIQIRPDDRSRFA